MKLVRVTVQVQYGDAVESILGRHEVGCWVRSGRLGGRDRDGRHDGSQAFPGNLALVQAFVPEESLEAVLEDLEAFRRAKEVHRHLVAAVLAVERSVGLDDDRRRDGEDGP